MSRRKFILNPVSEAALNTPTVPFIGSRPVIVSALIGQDLVFLNATNISGKPAPTITSTEVLDQSDTVLASATYPAIPNYIVASGKILRVKQTVVNSTGTTVTISLPIAAQVPTEDSWITPTAVPYNGATYNYTNVNQPGSWIYYIDPVNGVAPNSSTAMFYLQRSDGVIIDKNGLTNNPLSGLPYGTDISNPGAGIVWWKHWSAVGPTKDGLIAGIRTGTGSIYDAGCSPTTYNNVGRFNKPDCYFFKRGTSFDLYDDLTNYKTFATSWSYTYNSLLSLPGSSTGRNILASAGPQSLPPCRVTSKRGWPYGERVLAGTSDRVLISEIWLDGSVSAPYNEWTSAELSRQVRRGLTMLSMTNADSTPIRYQGLILDQTSGFGIPSTGASVNCQLTDSIIAYAHDQGVRGGLLAGDVTSGIDQHGNEDAKLLIKRCTIIECGYNFNPRDILSGIVYPTYDPARTYVWGERCQRNESGKIVVYQCYSDTMPAGTTPPGPLNVTFNPTGPAFINGSTESFYYWACIGVDKRPYDFRFRSRNAYLAGDTTIEDSILVGGGSGLQSRWAGKWKNNFIYAGYVFLSASREAFGLGGNNGNPNGTPANSWFINNVTQYRSGWGISHSGSWLELGVGLNDVVISGNLATGAQETIGASFGSGYVLNFTGKYTLPYSYPLRNTLVYDNTIDIADGGLLYEIDGAAAESDVNNNPILTGYVAPGLIGNKLYSNNVITSKDRSGWKLYIPFNSAPTSSDTVININNTQYFTRADYAVATNAPNVNITMKSYLQNTAGVSCSSIDGLYEFAEWICGRTTGIPMHRGNDTSSLHAPIINNAFRTAWARPLVN
jgi:hypothetical protein